MSTTLFQPIMALVRFAVPATVVMLLSGLFLVVDTYFIARLGTTELAGATLVFPVFMSLLTALGGGIGIGISAVISRRLGRGGVEEAQACVGTCLGLGLLVAVLFYAYQTLARAEWGLLFGFTRVTLVALPGVGLAVWAGWAAGFAATAIAVSFALYGLLSHTLFPLALHPRASVPAAPAHGLS